MSFKLYNTKKLTSRVSNISVPTVIVYIGQFDIRLKDDTKYSLPNLTIRTSFSIINHFLETKYRFNEKGNFHVFHFLLKVLYELEILEINKATNKKIYSFKFSNLIFLNALFSKPCSDKAYTVKAWYLYCSTTSTFY